MSQIQLDLFSSVLSAYTQSSGKISNKKLYSTVAASLGLTPEQAEEKVPIGKEQTPRNKLAQKIRWYQQTLKASNIIEKVEGERGVWQMTQKASKELNQIKPGIAVIGFSTELGIAILGSCDYTFSQLDAPITLVVTSPPYPLTKARAYGNVSEGQYIDWICKTLDPIVKNLEPGGSICLNISNDIFLAKSPARSLYRERLVLALYDRLGLFKMDELIWENRSKPPGPIQYASLQRNQLNVAWEPVYWFCNEPSLVKADNRRVLQQHTQKQLDLINGGGENRDVVNSDGAYIIRKGAYKNQTEGSIPKNVLSFGHRCASQTAYKKAAKEAGLPVHGAPMPLKLAQFLIKFLSKENDLVVDPFSGSFTTAVAAESLGRRWVGTELMLEYILGAGNRFKDCPGFNCNLQGS